MPAVEYPHDGSASTLKAWVREVLAASTPGITEQALDDQLRNFKFQPQFLIVLSFKKMAELVGKDLAAKIMLHLPMTEGNQADRERAAEYINGYESEPADPVSTHFFFGTLLISFEFPSPSVLGEKKAARKVFKWLLTGFNGINVMHEKGVGKLAHLCTDNKSGNLTIRIVLISIFILGTVYLSGWKEVVRAGKSWWKWLKIQWVKPWFQQNRTIPRDDEPGKGHTHGA